MEGQLHVLVIDDDEAIRGLLFDIASKLGHQVIAVASAEKGLELLPVWTFHVAFIDQHLPGMEGVVLGEYLRRNNPHMSIALVTGEDDRRLEQRSRDLEFTYITKPFRIEQVCKTIDDYVSGARERKERRRDRADADYAPPIAAHIDEVTGAYGVPHVPGRIEERLVATVKRSLSNLRSVGRYTERDRMIALAGLIAAKVLGLDLPRQHGRTLYEEYDALMREHHRRPEFAAPTAADDDDDE